MKFMKKIIIKFIMLHTNNMIKILILKFNYFLEIKKDNIK